MHQVMNNADAVDIATSLATLREIKWCQVCILLLDATEDQPLTHQVKQVLGFRVWCLGSMLDATEEELMLADHVHQTTEHGPRTVSNQTMEYLWSPKPEPPNP